MRKRAWIRQFAFFFLGLFVLGCSFPTVSFAADMPSSQTAYIASLLLSPTLAINQSQLRKADDSSELLQEVTKHPQKSTESTNGLLHEVLSETTNDALVTPQNAHQLNADVLFDLINAYRGNTGLKPFVKEAGLCALAQERAPELYNEIFITHTMHAGLYNRNIPYWITENMIYQPTEHDALNWWLHSSIHKKAIESDFTYSCGACSGNSCTELFTSYQPK